MNCSMSCCMSCWVLCSTVALGFPRAPSRHWACCAPVESSPKELNATEPSSPSTETVFSPRSLSAYKQKVDSQKDQHLKSQLKKSTALSNAWVSNGFYVSWKRPDAAARLAVLEAKQPVFLLNVVRSGPSGSIVAPVHDCKMFLVASPVSTNCPTRCERQQFRVCQTVKFVNLRA